MQQADFIHLIESFAPIYGAADWDNCSIQVAATRKEISRIAVALDPTQQTIAKALRQGADFILTHHPLYMKPKSLGHLDEFHQIVSLLINSNVALYSAHTSLDANSDGPVGWLGKELALRNVEILEPTYNSIACAFFVFAADLSDFSLPKEYVVKKHPAGAIVSFDSADIAPAAALKHIKEQLPAETIVSELPTTKGKESLGLGLIGDLEQECDWNTFASTLEQKVARNFWSVCGPRPDRIKRVGYCTGSGSSLAELAFARGADVFITGDVKYHGALDTSGCMIDVGHFSLEEEMMKRFAALLSESAPDVEITFLPAQDPIQLHAVNK